MLFVFVSEVQGKVWSLSYICQSNYWDKLK